ncbi:unnamed protein product, partial [Tenebrio molitor]
MVAFALSNGYLLNMVTLIIPKMIPPEKLEDAYHVQLVVTGILLG